jgi:pilus assembly protein CpaF
MIDPLDPPDDLDIDSDIAPTPKLPTAQTEYRTYGRRTFSIAALLERIEHAFTAEMRPETLLGATDDVMRRELIRDVADYVLAVESIRLPRVDYLALIDALDAILFRFGPLDPYLKDETVNEIAIDAPNRIYIRRGVDNPLPVQESFIDEDQLSRIVHRLLATGGVPLTEETPFVETGLKFAARPVRITAAIPPISATFQVGVRLHPSLPPTLTDLITSGFLSSIAADFLQNAIRERRGIMIAGDVGAGKTTLIQALLAAISESISTNDRATGAIVERAAELRPAEDAPFQRFAGIDFNGQIQTALANKPAWLILDEVRSEESPALWAALTDATHPALVCAIQGSTNPLRVRMTFNMTIQRTHHTLPADEITAALITRLPVAVLLSKQRVVTLGEWQQTPDGTVSLRTV